MRAFGLDIQTNVPQDQEVHRGLDFAWCEIFPVGEPTSITLTVNPVQQESDNVIPFVMARGTEYDLPYDLSVPVEWEGKRAKTRILDDNNKGYDNADALLWGAMASFLDVQFSVVARWNPRSQKNRYVAAVQVVYRGGVRITGDTPTFIPENPHFNHPWSDYAKTWQAMGQTLERSGRIADATAKAFQGDLGTLIAPAWQTAEIPAKDGWMRGTALYHNLVTMSGSIEGEDGQRYYFHSGGIRSIVQGQEEELVRPDTLFPVVEPGQGIYFQVEKGNRANLCIPYKPMDRQFKGR